jgi:hypothetical protein
MQITCSFCCNPVTVLKEYVSPYRPDHWMLAYCCEVCRSLGRQSWPIADWKSYKEQVAKDRL